MATERQKAVIVTGASSGIGKACAETFAARGYSVLLAARSADRLEQVAQHIRQQGGIATTCVADVRHREHCQRIVETCLQQFGRIDVLINNAGISMRALFAETQLKVIEDVVDINFWGTVYCTYYALPSLLITQGSVVGISSIAGFVGLPGRTGYSASKFAMNGFLEALRTENLKTGLHVLVVCPGYTASNIRQTALNKDGLPQGESPLDEQRLMAPETVAQEVWKGVQKRKRTILLTAEGKMAVWLHKFFPAWMDQLVYRKVAKEINSPFT